MKGLIYLLFGLTISLNTYAEPQCHDCSVNKNELKTDNLEEKLKGVKEVVKEVKKEAEKKKDVLTDEEKKFLCFYVTLNNKKFRDYVSNDLVGKDRITDFKTVYDQVLCEDPVNNGKYLTLLMMAAASWDGERNVNYMLFKFDINEIINSEIKSGEYKDKKELDFIKYKLDLMEKDDQEDTLYHRVFKLMRCNKKVEAKLACEPDECEKKVKDFLDSYDGKGKICDQYNAP